MQTALMEKKACLSCGAALRGRIDKKFCNDYCRNHYNNQLKQQDRHHPMVRQVNGFLLRNRRILQSLLPSGAGEVRVHREGLLARGFLFRYHTQRYRNAEGKTFHYCYDYGYLPLEKEWYLVVHRKEDEPQGVTS